MKKAIVLLVLASMCVMPARAWQPSGWVYSLRVGKTYLYSYNQTDRQWYYFSPNNPTRVCDLYEGTWWNIHNSNMRQGWSYWRWPYAYHWYTRHWYYIKSGTQQRVVNLSSRQWTRFGEAGASSLVSQYEARVHQLVNAHRASNGRAALAYDASISAIARVHSQNMANGSVPFGHDGFDTGYNNRVSQISAIMSISAWSENVHWNQGYSDPPGVCLTGWQNSPGHNTTMLNRLYNRAGVGAARTSSGIWYFTQIYVHNP